MLLLFTWEWGLSFTMGKVTELPAAAPWAAEFSRCIIGGAPFGKWPWMDRWPLFWNWNCYCCWPVIEISWLRLSCLLVVSFLDFKRFLLPPPLAGWSPLFCRVALFFVSSNLPPFTCSDAYDALSIWNLVVLKSFSIDDTYRDLSAPWFKFGLPRSAPPFICAGPPSFFVLTRFFALFFLSSLPPVPFVLSSSLKFKFFFCSSWGKKCWERPSSAF